MGMAWGLCSLGKAALRSQVEASAQGDDKVKFLPFRPADQVPHVLAAGDLHLITIKHGLEGVVVPSKLYSTLAAGRPIVVLAPEGSDAARVVRRLNCGVVVDPDDPARTGSHRPRNWPTTTSVWPRWQNERSRRRGSFARDKELQHFRCVIEGLA